ncbi:MAG TPA: hypothetical protein VJB57_15815 [Dehalococcoidia bacterium]|nr:hypothetical protein [Dehalococcoidia bacterium]
MTNVRSPLVVHFMLSGALITGTVDLQEERRRLMDLLNGQAQLVLTSVEITVYGVTGVKKLPTMTVSKDSILVAIPRETDEQNRLRLMQRSMVGRTATMQARVALLLPPLIVEGVAHGPGGAARLVQDPAIFSRFFSVTDAVITMADGVIQDLPVAIVNRDAMAGMSLLAEVKPVDRPLRPPSEPGLLDRLIANS